MHARDLLSCFSGITSTEALNKFRKAGKGQMSGSCRPFCQSLEIAGSKTFDLLNNSTSLEWKVLGLKEALTHLEEGIIEPSINDLACIVHMCRKAKDRSHGLRLHAYMSKNNLDAHISLGNYLVSMLVEVRILHNAQQVFNKLAFRNEWSWYSLIRGYVECGKPQLALILYRKMQEDGSVYPTGQTIVALLKACAKLKDLERGLEIHAHIARTGLLERDLFIGSTLIDMYAKCGSLVIAQVVFDKLQIQNVVSWNALMTAYANNGQSEIALQCLEKMEGEGVPPDAFTFGCSLKACGSIGHTHKVQDIHGEIEKRGLLAKDAFLHSTLIDVYAKCGCLTEAEHVFETLLVQSAASWNALMVAYAKQGHYEKAIMCFEQMLLEGVSPDEVSLACSLRACGSIGAVYKGQKLHAEIEKSNSLEGNIVIGSALVDMYTKCGMLFNALQALNKLPLCDVVAWTLLIAKHNEHGHHREALSCLDRMQMEGVSPNVITFVYSLKACCSLRAIDKGQEIHAEIERKGLLENNLFIGSILVTMYANCGLLSKGQQVFDKFLVQDVILWNTLITGYAQHGYGEQALEYFEQMQLEGFSPNAVTFVGSLKACGCIEATDMVQEIHVEVERMGLLGTDLVVGTTLVDTYAKCGLLSKAQQIFDKLPAHNVVSWNALITGYAENGHNDLALKCFEQMQLEGIAPDTFTLVSVMKSFGQEGSQGMVLELHSEIARMGALERDPVVGNALVDMYAKRGLLAKAQQVFGKLPLADVVSWNVLIAGYAEKGLGEETLKCFEQMQLQRISPNSISYICSLKACAILGFTDKGHETHAEIARKGFTDTNLVGNTLVDMYAKCGHVGAAQTVFDKLQTPDTVSCNSLITGYSQLGEIEKVFYMFDRMRREGMTPDSITFIVVLNACSCLGLYDKSQTYFEAMRTEYGIVPTLQHHACMVDLLGRAGQLDIANVLVKKIPFCPNLAVWRTMLGACRSWGNVDLGKQTFKHAVGLDEESA